MPTHIWTTTEEFEKIVQDWIATAKHPKTEPLYLVDASAPRDAGRT
jgi:hypothetical protein